VKRLIEWLRSFLGGPIKESSSPEVPPSDPEEQMADASDEAAP